MLSRAARRTDVHDLCSLLGVLQRRIDEDRADGQAQSLTVEQVLELVGRRAYGPLLLVIGLISISPVALIPGSTWLLATLTLLVAIQLALHRSTPWLPRPALNLKLSEQKLEGFIAAARPVARVLDKFIRPRLEFLADPPWIIGVAALCVLAALITFPLGLIPIAPLLPGLAISLLGLGVTAKDGLLLALGGVIIAGGSWLALTRII